MSTDASTSPALNRRVRVFVSSTFKDMKEDRDQLMTHVWPELRRFCRERQVELVEVDLRWGISEEQSTRRETLKLCLDEIRACRPFFIGLLGERYGWVPGDDAFTADLRQEQPWVAGAARKSVTELEILHGVLNDPAMAPLTYFYFRDPNYAHARGGDFLSEDARAAGRQRRLKARIRKACVNRRILQQTYADPGELAGLVLCALTAAIDERFPIEEIPDALTRKARDHEAFAEIRRRIYIASRKSFEALDRHARNDGGPLVVLGKSGTGKSALLANWLEHWRRQHPDDFVFQHYIGAIPDSVERGEIAGRLVGEIARWTNDDADLPGASEEILKSLPLWLVKARVRAEQNGLRCIVVLDALNQIGGGDDARRLNWLPRSEFTGPLRLIVSTTGGASWRAAKRRKWKLHRIQPMQPAGRRQMITEYLARFGKKLDPRRLDRLVGEPAAANPLYLKILLDELRVTGVHEHLDERLDDYLAARSVTALLQKVLLRYERDYERDCPGLVREVLALLFAARRGLAETEILQLMRPANLPQLPPALWAPLRAALEESLVDRGGILNFAHDFLRAAVRKAFAPPASLKALRLRLAEEFTAQPISARSCDELPWLLRKAGARDRLRTCLLEIDRFVEIEKRNAGELLRDWVWLREERTMSAAYLAPFRAWCQAGPAADTLTHCGSHLAYFFRTAGLYADAEPIMREVLATMEQRVGPEHRDVGPHLTNLALLLKATGRPAAARPLLERALVIAEQSYGARHANVATALDNLAQVLSDSGEFTIAGPLLRRALEIDEADCGVDDARVAHRLNNLAQLLQIAGQWEEAELKMQRALKIDLENLGRDHPTVAIRLNNLAQLLRATDRLEEAERMLREALAIDERHLGVWHPTVALVLGNLAAVLQATDQFDEAETLLRRALAIDERCFGPDHPDVAADLASLGSLWLAGNQLTKARKTLRRALKINERNFGANHERVAASLDQLAQVLYESDHPKEACRLARRAVSVAQRCFGPAHPGTIPYLGSLTQLLVACGKLREAEPLARKALQIAEAQTPPDPPALTEALRSLGLLLLDLGRNARATPLLRRALAVAEAYFVEPDHPVVGRCLNDLAQSLHANGEVAEGLRLMRRAWKITSRKWGPDHPETVAILKSLARLAKDAGQHEEAESFMSQALKIDTDRHGEDSPIVSDDRDCLRRWRFRN